MEQGQCETEHGLEFLLYRVDSGALLVWHLLVYLQHTVQNLIGPSKTNTGPPTSFSPNEKTGTRSALRKGQHRPREVEGNDDAPMNHGKLNEP